MCYTCSVNYKIGMDYIKTYIKLMRRCEDRQEPEGYTEKHHIFPRCMFGDNDRVVVLTPREHFISHLLLWKICESRYGSHHNNTYKLNNAFFLMCNTMGRTTSHHYSESRILHSKYMSQLQLGRKHTQESKDKRRDKMTGVPKSETHRKNLGLSRKGLLYWNDGTKNKMSRECPGDGWVRGQIKKSGFTRVSPTPETKQKLSISMMKVGRIRDSKGRYTKDKGF